MTTQSSKPNSPATLPTTSAAPVKPAKPWASPPAEKTNPLRILIVDGNWIDGLFLETICQGVLNNTLITRPHNVETLKIALQLPYELLILDTTLPTPEQQLLQTHQQQSSAVIIATTTNTQPRTFLNSTRTIIKTDSAEQFKQTLIQTLQIIKTLLRL
jgi:hypothetical protein